MIVLAIDPGSEAGLGWAVLDSEGLNLLHSGTVFIQRPDDDKHRDRSRVWLALLDILNDHGPGADVIAYEDVMKHSSVWAAHLYGGQIAMIQMWSALHSRAIMPVPVMTVKRFLRSRASGKAKLKAQVEAAHQLGYHNVKDHNEADALGIALGAVWLTKRNESQN
jgi:Holliday junction resolvasome RuvABC endonuclease subunit